MSLPESPQASKAPGPEATSNAPRFIGPPYYEFIAPDADSVHNEETDVTVTVLAAELTGGAEYGLGNSVVPDSLTDPVTISVMAPPFNSPVVITDPSDPTGHKRYTWTVRTPTVSADREMILHFLFKPAMSPSWKTKRTRVIRVKNV